MHGSTECAALASNKVVDLASAGARAEAEQEIWLSADQQADGERRTIKRLCGWVSDPPAVA